MKAWIAILAAALVAGLPFLFRREDRAAEASDAEEVIVVSPHNEDIRNEFGEAFAKWHLKKFGKPARVDWRVLGGTSEIMRYLRSEHATAKKNGGEGCKLDVWFGGGVYDHATAEREGITTPAWPAGKEPEGLLEGIPAEGIGERWIGKAYYGTVLSAFGICFNRDRMRDFGIADAPSCWEDLAKPEFAGSVALADPSKSGSVAKAFDLIVNSAMLKYLRNAGWSDEDIRKNEEGRRDEKYERDVAAAWIAGMNLVRRISANARCFTDSAGKVVTDVSCGTAAAGVCIDFFGKVQSEASRLPDGRAVMEYVSPNGETAATADPISMLAGAPHPETAARFIEFVLSDEGQRLWFKKPGEAGGPLKRALHRMPIRSSLYKEAGEDPLALNGSFRFFPRWTGRLFNIERDLIRAMCIDAGPELRSAWRKVHGNQQALAELEKLPLSWQEAQDDKTPRLERLSRWTAFFREQYRKAEALAK